MNNKYDTVILIPFRDRDTHLSHFIKNSWSLIKLYMPNSKLVVIHQEEGKLFNRGKLLNIGIKEYLDKTKYFIFHDVDLNPNSNTIKKYYKLTGPTKQIIGIYNAPLKICTLGGIIKIHNNCIKDINGFSNDLWGWGVEDRILYNRVIFFKKDIKWNLFTDNPDINKYFITFNNINDRKFSEQYMNISKYEYLEFQNETTEKQYEHIMSSGLNNLQYTILSRMDMDTDVEVITVSI